MPLIVIVSVSAAAHVPRAGMPRNAAISGRWVSMSPTSATIAQNAESDGDISSTIRHQISMPIGSRKCSPALTAGQVSSERGCSMSMSSGRSGHFAAIHAAPT